MNVYNLVRDEIDPTDSQQSFTLRRNSIWSGVTSHKIDHRTTCPEIYHQLNLGSCTASAACCVYYHNLVHFKYIDIFTPSRLFLYYNTRVMKHTVNVDNGASLRDTLKAINAYGMCPEDQWPYEPAQFTTKPTDQSYLFANQHKGIAYMRVPQILSQLKQCLWDGYLFVFGLAVFPDFESDHVKHTGQVSLPSSSEQPLGGHAACAIGFDDEQAVFIIRNSWGTQWGDHGYFYLPYEYMTNTDLVYDIWTFRNQIDEPEPIPIPIPVRPVPITPKKKHIKKHKHLCTLI